MVQGPQTRVMLLYEGCNYLRQRLVLSTLSGRPVRVRGVREGEDSPGLTEYEAGLVRLLDKLTNGSRIEVSETGTVLSYSPGLLLGGSVEHDCSAQRGVGYSLEPLLLLAPFAKHPLQVTLRGITTATALDPSVDYYRMCVLPMLNKSLPHCNYKLKLVKRGDSEGRGEVELSCCLLRHVKPLLLTQPGKVRRIRGVAHCASVSPMVASRMVDSARSVLNTLLPDVYIYTDVLKGSSQLRPGFGLTLVSESTTGVLHAAELSSAAATPLLQPEEVGSQTAALLLEEIARGGCVDSQCQHLPLLFMALAEKSVSKIQLGELSESTKHFLRHVQDFLQLRFRAEAASSSQALLSCVGGGYTSLSRRIT